MLLLSGLRDATVSPENSRKLATRVRALGGRAETRFYKRADHTRVIAAFSPALRWLAPSLADTIAFIGGLGGLKRPRRGSSRYVQPSRLA